MSAVFLDFCTTVRGGPILCKVASSAQGQIILSELSPPIYPPFARMPRLGGLDDRGRHSTGWHRRISGSCERPPVAERRRPRQCSEIHIRVSTSAKRYLFLFNSLHLRVHSTALLPIDAKAPLRGLINGQKNLGPGSLNRKIHVTILTDPFFILHPPADITKVRSAKCRFLWRCGERHEL